MSEKYCLVVNPAAGQGRSVRLLPAVLGPLAAAGARVRVSESVSLDHAATVAAEAAGQGEIVVAVGGDGTVGRMAAAVADAGGVLGIVPAGRGNDFARMLDIPTQPARAASILVAGPRRAVDLIAVSAGEAPELVVAGSVYLGILSTGAEIVRASRLAIGGLGYQLAGLRALRAWQRATFAVDLGTGAGPDGGFPGFAVLVANSAFLAGGKRGAPAADASDGLLDVIMVREGSKPGWGGGVRKLSFVRVMLMAGRGTHVRLAHVDAAQAASVTVTADRAMPAGADGETLPFAAPLAPGCLLRIRALPGVLRVITAPAAQAARGRARPDAQLSAGLTGRLRPPRKDSMKSGLTESSAGVPSILTSPPPST